MGVLSLCMAVTKASLAQYRPHKDANIHVRKGASNHPLHACTIHPRLSDKRDASADSTRAGSEDTSPQHNSEQSLAAQDMLETMATGALMCVPARVSRQQQSVLRGKDSGCVSLTPLLLCSWQRQTELISLRQKIAHARRRQGSTERGR